MLPGLLQLHQQDLCCTFWVPPGGPWNFCLFLPGGFTSAFSKQV